MGGLGAPAQGPDAMGSVEAGGEGGSVGEAQGLLPMQATATVRLASALEAAYAYVRQCVRASHGIRLLKQLLQPRPSAPSHFIGERVHTLCTHASCVCVCV